MVSAVIGISNFLPMVSSFRRFMSHSSRGHFHQAGGRWSDPDYPHFEMPMGKTQEELYYNYLNTGNIYQP